MERHFANMEHRWDRPSEDICVSLRLTDHWPDSKAPCDVPLGGHRFLCSQSLRTGHALSCAMPADGSDLESRHPGEMLFSSHHLPSRLHRVRT